MKEMFEKMEKLQKKIDKKYKEKFKKDKEQVKDKVKELVDEAEETLFCTSEKGVIAVGSAIEMVTAVGLALKNLIDDGSLEKEVVFDILEDIFDSNETEDDELEEIYNEFKEMFGDK